MEIFGTSLKQRIFDQFCNAIVGIATFFIETFFRWIVFAEYHIIYNFPNYWKVTVKNNLKLLKLITLQPDVVNPDTPRHKSIPPMPIN